MLKTSLSNSEIWCGIVFDWRQDEMVPSGTYILQSMEISNARREIRDIERITVSVVTQV